jgi:hypothetical protein
MYLRKLSGLDSIKSPLKLVGPLAVLCLPLLAAPAHAETPPWELVAEVAVEVPIEVPVELGSTDGGADGADGGADMGLPSDGPRADTAPSVDATTSDGLRDLAPATSDGGKDAANQEESDGDCGCSLGGVGKRGAGALPLLGAFGGLFLIARRRRRA